MAVYMIRIVSAVQETGTGVWRVVELVPRTEWNGPPASTALATSFGFPLQPPTPQVHPLGAGYALSEENAWRMRGTALLVLPLLPPLSIAF